MGSLVGRAGLVQSGLNNLSCKKKEPSLTTVHTIEQGETMDKKINGVSPTNATDAEMKRFLLKHAISGLQKQAGYIPPHQTDWVDNEPTFKVHYSMHHHLIYNGNPFKRWIVPFVVVYYLTSLECNEPICRYCAYSVSRFFAHGKIALLLGIMAAVEHETCILCGGICDDDPTPF
jgi:hypothetical protein